MKKEDLFVGQKVRVVKRNLDCNMSKNGISWISSMDFYNGKVIKIMYIYINCVSDGEWYYDFDWLDPVDELECLEEGSLVKDNEGIYRTILGKVCGSGKLTLYAVSDWARDLDSLSLKKYSCLLTAYTIKEWDYKPYHPEAEVEEMTMSEVCKALGKNVKIKKD